MRENPKSEDRSPKEVRRPKSQGNAEEQAWVGRDRTWAFGFPSDFGLRVSDLRKGFRFLVLLIAALIARRGLCQYIDPWQGQQTAQDASWVPTLKYIKTDIEAERDSFHSPSGGQQQFDRLYVSPAIGIGWAHYIYHPYLLTYSVLFEPGYILRYDGPTDAMRRTDDIRLDGNVTVNLLQLKPYASTLTYDRSHGEIKYDLFNSAIVDSEGWGISTGYREGPVPVTLSFQQSHEESNGFNQNTTSDQSTINLHGQSERKNDNISDLTYQYGQFEREIDVSGPHYRSENSYHHLSIMDTEHFRKSTLKSQLLFYDLESGSAPSSTELNGTLNYNTEHAPSLHSFEDYSFSYFSGNSFDSIQNYWTAGLNHQLYESLNSGLEVHGSTLNSSSEGATLDSISGGAGASVDYNKRLGNWGRLSLGNNSTYTITEQESSGGQLVIADESYTVPANSIVRLNQPREISVDGITDASHNPLLFGLDYTINRSTDPWQIQILPFGPGHVQSGAVIFITYTIQSNPSGNYSVFANQCQLSLHFLDEMASVFIRYHFTDNRASSPEFLLQDDEEVQVGAEFNWRGVALHGDYTDHHSTLYDFHGYNLSESYSRNLFSHTTLGIDLNQQWTTFSSHDQRSERQVQHLTFYSFMFHYQWQPATRLNFNAEAGYRRQRGLGFDQDLFAVRTYLNWAMGKLEVHLGYEHENQQLTRERKDRDFGFLRMKRSF